MYPPGWTPELSDWIDGSVPPQILGVYRREFASVLGVEPSEHTKHFSRWDGAVWRQYGHTPTGAMGSTHPSTYQSLPWQGLARDPAVFAPGWRP